MSASNPAMEILVRSVASRRACAFVATGDGHILDANHEGWKLVESWWRERGREEMAAWLGGIAGRHDQRIVFIGCRSFSLKASRVPLCESTEALFAVSCEELFAGGSFSLDYVARAYGLSRRESAALNLKLLGCTLHEIAAQVYLTPRTCQVLLEELRRKLARKRDPFVKFRTSRWGGCSNTKRGR